jgi:hypothetical protein
MMQDNFDEAISKLNSITVLLYGGYYEPKSDRDLALARRVDELLKDAEASKVWYDINGNLKEYVCQM